MMPVVSPVVGRLAPSPTGGLHLGHARTFLLAWFAARSAGGRIILRIEDLDASRTRPDAISGMTKDISWLGLDWDEGPDIGGVHAPYLQSQRADHYEQMLNELKNRELVYPCTCTRADIARAASAPHEGEEGAVYPGTCSSRSAGDARVLEGRRYSWRFRVPDADVAWTDLSMGPCLANPSRVVGDFVVSRSSGEAAYQLAVVCDDHLMGVNQVVRGNDLVTSTPRQILLYHAMGWQTPRFGHVPLVVDREGKRLAKRDQSIKLESLRLEGVDPQHLTTILARSCGLDGISSVSSPDQWVERFDLTRIPRHPWVAPDLQSLRADQP